MSEAKKDGGHHAPTHDHGKKHHDHHGPHWLEIIAYVLVWIVAIQVIGTVITTLGTAFIENKKPGYDLRLVSPQGRALIETVQGTRTTATVPTAPTPKRSCEDTPFTPTLAPGTIPGTKPSTWEWSEPVEIPLGYTLDRNPNVNHLDAPYWMLCTSREGTEQIWEGKCPGKTRQVQFVSKTAEAVLVSTRICPTQHP